MKKIIVPLLVLLLIGSIAFAQEMQGNETGQQSGASDAVENKSDEPAIMPIMERIREKARTETELMEMIQERTRDLQEEVNASRLEIRETLQNQNKVRLAVHALLAMEDIVGGIGSNISQIARDFNNSQQVTLRLEERIEARNAVMRFLMGGDEAAAGELEQEMNQTRTRIQDLKQLREECSCSDDIKNIIQEQIQSMEQEQERLQQLAQEEKQNKGLLGWLWK